MQETCQSACVRAFAGDMIAISVEIKDSGAGDSAVS